MQNGGGKVELCHQGEGKNERGGGIKRCDRYVNPGCYRNVEALEINCTLHCGAPSSRVVTDTHFTWLGLRHLAGCSLKKKKKASRPSIWRKMLQCEATQPNTEALHREQPKVFPGEGDG